MTRVYLADLEARAAEWYGLPVVRSDVRTEADGSHCITYTFQGGRTGFEKTSACRLVLPHEERT